jgi:hypothetical protein
VTVAQLTDTDPLFAQFLRAGAARVNAGARRLRGGDDEYLSTGELWAGEEPGNSEDGDADPLHLSIIASSRARPTTTTSKASTLTVTKCDEGPPAAARRSPPMMCFKRT